MLNIFFEEGGKGKRGTHYYNIEGKEERKKERKKEDQEDKKGKSGIRTDEKREKRNLVKGFYYSQKHL